ncbi:oligosaccharide flippase family protein [Priestia aryabhattai]|uniref:oligosaccharide flippase family protein n=1 Tax=Priestia aryabhattai TaxID=412384 RepID=UPI00064EA77B|nr:oligosaccharide flippase family protein [Priestia aryabhattai]KML28311.1 hypothetical protein VL11_16420 [Priestia aryabhattai]KMO01684.1 hypothetical protein ABV89_01425 [Priestia aryabhattai]
MKKNLFLMTLTMLSQFLSTVVIFILLARIWEVEVYGEFMFLYVFGNILSVVIDYGYSLKLVKDFSRITDTDMQKKYFNEALYSKVYILVGITIAFIVSIVIMDLTIESTIAFAYIYFSFVFNSFAQFFLLPFRAGKDMKVESVTTMVCNIGFIISLMALVVFNKSILAVTFLFMLAKLIFLVVSFIVQKKYYDFDYKYSFTQHNEYIRQIASNFPYSIQLIISVLYFQVDTLIIGGFLNHYEVGIYQSSMRIVSGLLTISAIFSNAYLPYISKITNEKISETNFKYTSVMVICGAVIGLVQYVFGEYLITFLYGNDYKEAGIILRLLSIMVFVRYIGVSYSVILTVMDKQYLRAIAVSAALLTNVLLNVILVPNFGLIGAVTASILTNIILLIIYYSMARVHLRREVGYN